MWRTISRLVLLGGLALSSTACACRHPATGCRFKAVPRAVIGNLSHARADVRRDAAQVLRTKRGVPESAVQPLVDALLRESDKDTHGEILITLGYSGTMQALEHIYITLRIPDSTARTYGADALWAWRVARGLETDTDRPDSFRPVPSERSAQPKAVAN